MSAPGTLPVSSSIPAQRDARPLRALLTHSGVISGRRLDLLAIAGAVRHNAAVYDPACTPAAGDRIEIEGRAYRVIVGGGRGRLQLEAVDLRAAQRIAAPVRVHAGYHKCMTEFVKHVYRKVCASRAFPGRSFEHYFHRLDAFYNHCDRHAITSVSGNAIALDRFADIRVVRFIRDPRDLLVSAYYYHRRGGEHWCLLEDPTDTDWRIVNGAVPQGLRGGESFTAYLNRVPLQEGLAAEIEFRRHHFESMRAWPRNDPRVRVFRYEDVLGREARVFGSIVRFFGLPVRSWPVAARYARRYAAGARGGKQGHIRNAASGQWREHFGPELRRRFDAAYGDLLERYGYPGG